MDWQAQLEAYIAPRKRLVDDALETYLAENPPRPRTLPEAMRYAVLGGGKRFRPILCIAAAEALGVPATQVLPTACALELIHAFSLVHDDLPAMDNDHLRRNQPTVWVKYSEAMAILAGDALFAKAFELLAEQARLSPPERVAQVLHLIAVASGTEGMCGGQVEDILCEGQAIGEAELRFIHSHKTGALIRASVLAGALLAGADSAQQDALDAYSRALGLAFQIIDDVLDETASTEQLGKTAGADRARRKATYPALFGIETARQHAEQAKQDALNALRPFDERADPLRWLALYTVARGS
ncbi:MAG: polyprenyl synthetase family protein [Fimbriimonadales bacterium]|nr:polyprenyl synthetase family protein [Fimbriimonadales bacterium]